MKNFKVILSTFKNNEHFDVKIQARITSGSAYAYFKKCTEQYKCKIGTEAVNNLGNLAGEIEGEETTSGFKVLRMTKECGKEHNMYSI